VTDKARKTFSAMQGPRHVEIDEIIDVIRELWHASPSLRLGQMLTGLTPLLKDGTRADLFYVGDETLSVRASFVIADGWQSARMDQI
jgi:hypothetical protein